MIAAKGSKPEISLADFVSTGKVLAFNQGLCLLTWTDDTELGRVVNTEEERINIQYDCNRLKNWGKTNNTDFNGHKMSVSALRSNKQEHKYKMGRPGLLAVYVDRIQGSQ